MMELKPGFKQTEVGVIPEDWKVIEYNHIGQIIDGDRGVHYPSSGELKDTGYCLFLNAGNVTKSGFQFKDCTFITKEKDEKLNKGKLRRYDVVLTTRGTVGNFAYFDESVNHENVRINSGMVILRNTSKNIDTKYQYVVLRSKIVGLQVERMAFGSAQPQLTVKGINLFKIPLPPTTAEQTAIASTLSDADTLIQSLTRLITKKHQIKQGAMQILLNPYENGRLKAGWEVKKLGDVADIRSGGTPSTRIAEFWNGEILWCTPTDITALRGKKYLYSTSRKITSKGLAVSSAEIIPENSIVMTSRATIGECAINKLPVSTNQGFKNFVPYKDVDIEFLYYQLLTQKREFIGLCSGSTFLEISKNQLFNFEIQLPRDVSEQTRIATILSDMDAEIAALETKLAKYQHIKQGMMQNLLTGKIRLI